MFCDRWADEVLLSCDDGKHAWLVEALLHRTGGDVQEAARLVTGDVATGATGG